MPTLFPLFYLARARAKGIGARARARAVDTYS